MSDFLDDTQETSLETEVVSPRSLLAIEVGSIHTRASLFDMVEGRYRYLATGISPTSHLKPIANIQHGILNAVENLSQLSGRSFVDEKDQFIIPANPQGMGADNLSASVSFAPAVRTVVIGLLDKVSLNSALRLANSSYTQVIETISVSEHGHPQDQINKIINAEAKLIILAGGTEGGASKTLLKMIELIRMAVQLIPVQDRPEVLFVGNDALNETVMQLLDPHTKVHTAPNIRPGLSTEQLQVAKSRLAEVIFQIQQAKNPGMQQLLELSGGLICPSATAFGRVVEFFSQIVRSPKERSVLGIDIGAENTCVAAGFDGDLRLHAMTGLGMGTGLSSILKKSKLRDISRWVIPEVSNTQIVNAIQNKILNPGTLPATEEALAIEHALAREVLQQALQIANLDFPKNIKRVKKGALPNFDPILVSGSTLSFAPHPAQSLLILLDALQPIGVQQFILDKNSLAVALGSAIPVNPTLVSQLLLDPIAFLNLGFVVSPESSAREGSPILKIRLDTENGHSESYTVHKGQLLKLPLPLGQQATAYFDPLQWTNLGDGPGKRLPPQRVVGGPFGLIVDGRGRPLQLPKNAIERRAKLKEWQKALIK